MIAVKTTWLFWRLTFKDILSLLCAVAVPIALAIYTSTTHSQQRDEAEKARNFDFKQAAEARQQTLYDTFLNDIYELDKNGYLAENKTPWAFANAYYRAAHRQWDVLRKGDILQFLKEQQLIGRSNCTTECRQTHLQDIIRLNELSFDNVRLSSQTGVLYALKLECVTFDQVSLANAQFSFVNLHGASFDGGRLNNAIFEGSSLKCVSFIGVDLHGVDFGDSNLTGVLFSNVDLSNTKLTQEQLEQAIFHNTTLPKGISNQTRIRTLKRERFCCLFTYRREPITRS